VTTPRIRPRHHDYSPPGHDRRSNDRSPLPRRCLANGCPARRGHRWPRRRRLACSRPYSRARCGHEDAHRQRSDRITMPARIKGRYADLGQDRGLPQVLHPTELNRCIERTPQPPSIEFPPYPHAAGLVAGCPRRPHCRPRPRDQWRKDVYERGRPIVQLLAAIRRQSGTSIPHRLRPGWPGACGSTASTKPSAAHRTVRRRLCNRYSNTDSRCRCGLCLPLCHRDGEQPSARPRR